jgi:MFS family permease
MHGGFRKLVFLCKMMFLNRKNSAFSVDKFPFFYGWIVLVVGTIGVLVSIPGQTMGVSVFTDYLLEALNIERTELSLAYLIGTLISGLIITRAGRLYDKYGASVMAIVSGVMLGVILLGFSNIDRLINSLLPAFSLVEKDLFTILVLIIFFFGIRFFGQGVLTMVSRNMVMKWFDKKRGFAIAIMGIFISLGFSIAPLVLNEIIEMWDWRQAWLLLGFIAGVPFVVIVLLFFRDNPQDSGCLPDGMVVEEGTKKVYSQNNFTLKEAVRTYSFWIFNLNLVMNGLLVTALTFHIVSIFGEAGFDRQTAVSIFIPASFFAVAFNFIGGWLSDHTKLKYILVVNLFAIILTTFSVANLGNINVAYYLLIAGIGISSGLFSVLNSVTWPRFFGTRHLGEISGFSLSWVVIGSAIGPFLFSLSLKYSDSYSSSAYICMTIAIILFVLAFKADRK